jgi:hypothetical protein
MRTEREKNRESVYSKKEVVKERGRGSERGGEGER